MAERVAGEPVEGQSYDQDQVAGSKKGAITGATSAVPTAAPIERRRTGGRARRRTQVERRLSRDLRSKGELPTAIQRSARRAPCWTPGRNLMTDAGSVGKASIDWDHLDATDSTSELGSLI